MLFTVFEESSVDSHEGFYGPPPGNLDSFYDLTQDAPEASGSKNVKKEISEKHVEEVVVPVEDEEDHPEEAVNTQSHMDDFPDGGLRAWLVILGVSVLLSFFTSFILIGM